MLVLTRKKEESICIGSNIHITVLAIQGGRVRIGVEAPRDVSIHRAELQRWISLDERELPADAHFAPLS